MAEVLARYMNVVNEADIRLSRGCIVWLNLLERVAASSIPWIASTWILDKDLEDPDIEAKYVFEGDGSATIVAPTPPNG